jgi:competence protein ComEC
VRYGDAVFLLSGDIGAAVETQIHAGPVDVLKVPHHGSPTSSSPGFVAELAPRVAIISRGRRNDWSGGVDEVSERYRRAGAQVYRTDRDGAVTVATDGQTLWIGAGRGPVTVLAHRARRS